METRRSEKLRYFYRRPAARVLIPLRVAVLSLPVCVAPASTTIAVAVRLLVAGVCHRHDWVVPPAAWLLLITAASLLQGFRGCVFAFVLFSWFFFPGLLADLSHHIGVNRFYLGLLLTPTGSRLSGRMPLCLFNSFLSS